jgi:hypothetical protein
MAFENENEIGLPRIVACNYNRFFRVAAAGFRVQFDCDRSLAAGRDSPVEMGNGAASAGEHLFYIQDAFADILDIEFVNELSAFG